MRPRDALMAFCLTLPTAGLAALTWQVTTGQRWAALLDVTLVVVAAFVATVIYAMVVISKESRHERD